MSQGRSHYVLKNTSWEMGYYILVVLLGFLAPRFIILIYGSSVNGLSSSITQILNFILLLQSGAATAAIYSLYKPIADNDIEKICSKLSSATAYFKKLSYLFLVLMLLAALITSWTLESEIDASLILVAFVIMGMKSFLDLYFTSTYRILFTAFQEKFIISIATLIEQIVYYALVFTTLFFKWHFILLFFWLFLGCVVKIIYLNNRAKVMHRIIIHKKGLKEAFSSHIEGKNYALINEVSHMIISTSPPIIISFMYGLKEASVYSVYMLVFSALYLVMTSLNSSFAPSFGNLYASGDIERSKEVFSIFQFLYLLLNMIMMMCVVFLLLPFVSLYVSGVDDINYHNETLAVLSVLSGIFSAFRIPYNVMVSSLGFFKETWIQPMVTCALCLFISFVFGKIDYTYVLFGPIVFYAVNFLYQHYKLNKLVPEMIDNRVFLILLITLIGVSISFLFFKSISWDVTVIHWLIAVVLVLGCSTVYSLLLSKICFNKLFLASYNYINIILCKIRL